MGYGLILVSSIHFNRIMNKLKHNQSKVVNEIKEGLFCDSFRVLNFVSVVLATVFIKLTFIVLKFY